MKKITLPTFGAKVSISAKYARSCRNEQQGIIYKYWKVATFVASGCLFLGTRTLHNGIMEYDIEEGWTFSQREHFEAALVCLGPRRKPILVPLDAVTVCVENP